MSPEISLIKKVGGMEYVVKYAPVKWAKIEMPSKFCPVINIPHLIPTEYAEVYRFNKWKTPPKN